LLSLATAFGLTERFECSGIHLIIDIFGAIAAKQNILIDSIFTSFVKDHGKTRAVKASPGHISENYRKLRRDIQSKTNVRIAVIGGLHRTALATHILGNYIIHNKLPELSKTQYAIDKTSSVNSGIGVHIMLPRSGQHLDGTFMQKSRDFSESVNNRKFKAVKDTVRGQMYDLLKMRSDENINKLRYLPNRLFTDIYVCTTFIKTSFSFFEYFPFTNQPLYLYFFSLC
jgi:hypothetical protein